MKLSFSRTDFLAAARRLCRVAPETSPTPLLTGILLKADADNLEVTLTATDLETTISCALSAAVYESGSLVINALLFTNMLRLFGEPTVSMELLPNWQLSLTCGNAVFTIGTLPGKDFPSTPVTAPEYVGEITNLPMLVKSTAFLAAKTSDSMPKNCVRLDISGKTARTVTTDGGRLMSCKKPMQEKNKEQTLLIPAAAFSLLASLVENEDKLRMKSSAKAVTFETEQMTFTTRLGVGSYIDADSVLSNITGCYEALVDADVLQEALDVLEVGAVAGDQLHMVFQLDGIALDFNGERTQAATHAIAQVASPMPPEGFYYPLKNFCQGIYAMSGLLKLSVASSGFLMIEGDGQSFLQSPVRYKARTLKPHAKPKAETDEKPTKKTKTKKPASKAA